MWRTALAIAFGVAVAGGAVAHTVFAQNRPDMPHAPDMHAQHMQAMREMAANTPAMPGQDAFGAIAEIVRILEADPATDWSTVDIERLRQHLIAMNEVMLRAVVAQTPVPGGLAMEITGTGRTEQAIRAMVVPHAVELDRMPLFAAKTAPVAHGVRLDRKSTR